MQASFKKEARFFFEITRSILFCGFQRGALRMIALCAIILATPDRIVKARFFFEITRSILFCGFQRGALRMIALCAIILATPDRIVKARFFFEITRSILFCGFQRGALRMIAFFAINPCIPRQDCQILVYSFSIWFVIIVGIPGLVYMLDHKFIFHVHI